MIDYNKLFELGIKLKNISKDDLNNFQKLTDSYRSYERYYKNKSFYPLEFNLKLQKDFINVIKKRNPEFLMLLNKNQSKIYTPQNPWYAFYNKLDFYNSIKIQNSDNTFLILGFVTNNKRYCTLDTDYYNKFFCDKKYYNIDKLYITIIGKDINKYKKIDLEELWKSFKLKYGYSSVALVEEWIIRDGYDDIKELEKYYSRKYIEKVFGIIKLGKEIGEISKEIKYEFV